jgi:hypothetical protein
VRYRYSVFVSASLLITFITLTAAFLRTLQWVGTLADCTQENSQCLYDVQRWFYVTLVEGLVQMDIETLELQRTGSCSQVTQGTSAIAAFGHEPLPANSSVAEVCHVSSNFKDLQLATVGWSIKHARIRCSTSGTHARGKF